VKTLDHILAARADAEDEAPSLISSTVAAVMAISAGERLKALTMPVPSLIRLWRQLFR
jgi:hypothetical protein